MTEFQSLGLSWRCLHLPGPFACDLARARAVERRIHSVIASWEDTPYAIGQAVKGVGVFCTAFVSRVLDELYRQEPVDLPNLPQDVSFHNRDGAVRGMRWFLERYPNDPVEDGVVEPGDVLVTGPDGGGPGHAMIVGARENTIWQSSGRVGVHFTGMSLATDYVLHRIFRPRDRHTWV